MVGLVGINSNSAVNTFRATAPEESECCVNFMPTPRRRLWRPHASVIPGYPEWGTVRAPIEWPSGSKDQTLMSRYACAFRLPSHSADTRGVFYTRSKAHHRAHKRAIRGARPSWEPMGAPFRGCANVNFTMEGDRLKECILNFDASKFPFLRGLACPVARGLQCFANWLDPEAPCAKPSLLSNPPDCPQRRSGRLKTRHDST